MQIAWIASVLCIPITVGLTIFTMRIFGPECPVMKFPDSPQNKDEKDCLQGCKVCAAACDSRSSNQSTSCIANCPTCDTCIHNDLLNQTEAAERKLATSANQKGGTMTAADCLRLNMQCNNNCYAYMDAWAKMVCFSACLKASDMCMNVANNGTKI